MARLFVFIGACLLVTQVSFGAIYGLDNRRDISQSSKKWKTRAQSVALALPKLYLEELDSDTYFHSEYKIRNYGENVGICKQERFSEQTTFGHCSAFLVHPKILVSAGHCFLPAGEVKDLAHDYCEQFVFWMGYNDKEHSLKDIGSIIPKKDLAVCKKVIHASNNQFMDPEENPIDFAIYELETPIEHRPSLTVASYPLKKGQMISTIGHPHGLPAKFSGFSSVLDVHDTTYSSNMDTLSGNSGGPAFNRKGDVVGILISGHQHDTYEDKKKKCDRINRCRNDGSNCNIGSDLEESNLLLRSEVWYPIIEEYLNSSKQALVTAKQI